MKITSNTKYADFAQYEFALTEDSTKALMEQAEQLYGHCNELTIDQFWGLMGGDYSILGDLSNPSVLQVYWSRRFKEYCEQFTQICERLKLEPREDEQKAQKGCIEMTPMEGMLIFVRSYFNLPSFAEAGKRTLGEYIVARKDKYNEARTQRNFEDIQRAKFKKK